MHNALLFHVERGLPKVMCRESLLKWNIEKKESEREEENNRNATEEMQPEKYLWPFVSRSVLCLTHVRRMGDSDKGNGTFGIKFIDTFYVVSNN